MSFTLDQIKTFRKLDYPPDLYQFDTIAAGIEDGFEHVSDEDIEFFHHQGYLVVKDAFNTAEIESAVEGIHNLIEKKYSDFRGVQIEPKLLKQVDDLTPSQYRNAVRKVYNYLDYEPLLKEIFYAPKLLQIVAQMIDAQPVHLQDMALLKPAGFGTEKPWHQDCAYFNFSLGETVVGVWIALDKATANNGCMHVIPGSHKAPQLHFKKRDWQICDTDIDRDKDVLVPLNPGSVLFFHGMIHHGTAANHSDQQRWALQFHYRSINAVNIAAEERLEIFGAEGKDVTC